MNRVLPLNPSLSQVPVKVAQHVFTPFVIVEDSNSPPSDILCPCLILLKQSENIQFLCDVIYSGESQVIVHEGDPIGMAVTAPDWYQAMDISIHLLEWGFGAHGVVGVRHTGELPVDTVFTEVSLWLGTH